MNNQTLAEFDDFYETKLKSKLFEEYENAPECIRNIIKRFDSMIDYNAPHGKKLRGLCVYESLSLLVEDRDTLTKSKLLDQGKAIGWCVEFVSRLIFLFLYSCSKFSKFFQTATSFVFDCG